MGACSLEVVSVTTLSSGTVGLTQLFSFMPVPLRCQLAGWEVGCCYFCGELDGEG